MRHLYKQPLFYISIFSLLAFGLTIGTYVFGWDTPTQSPPAGNVTVTAPAGAVGYLQFYGSSTTLNSDSNLFWDNVNKRLGIGTVVPEGKLHLYSSTTDAISVIDVPNSELYDSLTAYRILGQVVWNTGIDNNDLNKFKISSGDNWNNIGTGDRLTIDTSGNVGIGTASPGARLDINVAFNGNTQLRLGGPINPWYITSAYNYTNSDLYFTAGSNERVRVNANGQFCIGYNGVAGCRGSAGLLVNGNVGIGTTSPAQKLSVAGTIESTSGGFKFPDGTTQASAAASSISGTTNYLTKFTSANAIGNSVVYETGGSVGIGTTSPNSLLEVVSSIYPVAKIVRTSILTDQTKSSFASKHQTTADMVNGFGSDFSFMIQDSSGVENEIANFGAMRDGADNNGALAFWTRIAGIKYERMRILSGGDVGIGTTSPGTKLEVAGQVKITGGTPGVGKVLTSDAVGLASWAAPAAGNPGTVTSITAGTGLTGGTITSSGTIAADTAYLQRRVANCTTNQAIQTIAADGTVGCYTIADTSATNEIQTLGTSGNTITLTGSTSVTAPYATTAGSVTNGVYINAANSFSLINPLTTIAESWIGPSTTNGIYFKGGNVGIGTITPGYKLEVAGQVKITGGSPGVNKVLTSDANGLASWAAPAATPPGGSVTQVQFNVDGVHFSGDAELAWSTINKQLSISTAQGKSPFVITSTTTVANLNVDYLDGYHSADLLAAAASLPGELCPSQLESSDRSAATFANAVTTCRNLGDNWRLPTAEELSCFIGASGVSASYLWTRTPYYGSSSSWVVIRLTDGTWYGDYYTSSNAFRCVR